VVINDGSLTQQDIDNEYITVGNQVAYITFVYPPNRRSGFDSSIFNIEYQLHLNDLFDLSFVGNNRDIFFLIIFFFLIIKLIVKIKYFILV